jgi:hypothetical protein
MFRLRSEVPSSGYLRRHLYAKFLSLWLAQRVIVVEVVVVVVVVVVRCHSSLRFSTLTFLSRATFQNCVLTASFLKFLVKNGVRTYTHIYCRTPLNEWAFRPRRRYLQNTQRKQETNVHALSGIRTRVPSKQAAAVLRFRLSGHRARFSTPVTVP